MIDTNNHNENILTSKPTILLDDKKNVSNAAAFKQTNSTILNIFKWNNASSELLIEAENCLLKKVKLHITSKFVKVRFSNSLIYTLIIKPTEDSEVDSIPFVLLHGFGAGSAIWSSNFDDLAQKRTVYAFDILGFGRSDRPKFSEDATLVELEFVQSVEDWRKEMKIEKMILVGHSFGGFIASSYALEYPNRVRHLVLVDSWGFPEKPTSEQFRIPVWMRVVGSLLSKFNPLATLRVAGPFGVRLMRSLRADLASRYSKDDPNAIYQYIYQCNAQSPSGEEAFRSMTKSFAWAKRPMINRFCGIDTKIPVTFICGSKSWVDSGLFYEIQSRRNESYVNVQIIALAGHHVYVDASEAFNSIMSSISNIVKLNDDVPQSCTSKDAAFCSNELICTEGGCCSHN